MNIPRCIALNCRKPANRIVILKNLLGNGDFVKRLCDGCFLTGKGIGGGYDTLLFVYVKKWHRNESHGSGYVRKPPKKGEHERQLAHHPRTPNISPQRA